MHCSSRWHHPNILPMRMDQLTLTDVHLDDRYLWKTLPSMRSGGMNYPLLVWTVSESYWETFCTYTPGWMLERLPLPNCVDGSIHLIKGGNNRYQSARDLGFSSIDCLILESQRDAILWARYLDQCDPLNNPHLPFLGLVEYK